ncbi:MAG: S9 family peptidase [Thermoplasmata archaeon]
MNPLARSPAAGRPNAVADGGARARLAAWLAVAQATAPAVAADSETVLFLSNEAGWNQPWAVSRRGGEARCLWPAEERVGSILPSPIAAEAVVAQDRAGDEQFQLGLLPWEGHRPVVTPLSPEGGVIHAPGCWDPDGQRFYFTSNARDRRFFDVYAIEVHGTAPPQRLVEEDGWLDVMDARDGRLLLARRRSNLDTELLVRDDERVNVRNPHTEEVSVLGAALGARGEVYAASNPGRERTALVRLRPGSAAPEFLREYPGDVELLRVHPTEEKILLTVNREGFSDTYLVDPATGEDRPLLSGPKGVIASMRWCPDGAGYVYELSHAEGSEIYFRATETGKERRLSRAARPLPGHALEPLRGTIRSSDRLTIPYWEYVAPGGGGRGTLLFLHGGPESQARPGFVPVLQWWAHEGWRVIAPNIRGSTGYGRTYVHLDDGRRRMDAVRDLQELTQELLRGGRARAGRIVVAGGSYGGFLVLSALSSYPELFAAGIDMVGISNFLTFLEKTGAWRRRFREAEYGRLVEDREFLKEISPLYRADRIRAPLFVVHGRTDPRVPFSEAEQIVATLRANGRTVELLEYADEGHGLHRRAHQEETWSRALDFLDRHLPSEPKVA